MQCSKDLQSNLCSGWEIIPRRRQSFFALKQYKRPQKKHLCQKSIGAEKLLSPWFFSVTPQCDSFAADTVMCAVKADRWRRGFERGWQCRTGADNGRQRQRLMGLLQTQLERTVLRMSLRWSGWTFDWWLVGSVQWESQSRRRLLSGFRQQKEMWVFGMWTSLRELLLNGWCTALFGTFCPHAYSLGTIKSPYWISPVLKQWQREETG